MPTFITLFSFNGTDGADPRAGLIADAAGDLFGTTENGGAYGTGTVFEIAKISGGYASTPTTLVSFNSSSGGPYDPAAGLLVDATGNLFGTTSVGGAYGYGTVFEIPKTGGGYAATPTTLVSFNGTNTAYPYAGLIADAAGDLFGTTSQGGTNSAGTVFEIAKTGSGYASTPTTLVTFNGGDGSDPQSTLIADAAGDLFGTTSGGGAYREGTVFEIAKTSGGYASTPTTLVSFNLGPNGYPVAGLISDAAGNLFGTTFLGGPNNAGTVFEIVKTNSGYANTPTTLATFNVTNGYGLFAGLIVDAAGDLFGTTYQGGTYGDGTVFEIARTGSGYASTLTTLISFNGNNGSTPIAGLITDAAGDLFGTTSQGGTNNAGTAFELTSVFTVLTVTINGAAQEGQTLTANPNGSIAGYQWQELVGGAWTNISGATGSSYLVQEADEGDQIRVQATGNRGLAATSAATAATLDAAPTVTTPVITGTAQDGQTLTASAAAGQSDNTVTYQWLESSNGGASFQNITGATSSTYLLKEMDVGDLIEVTATVTNDNGATISATSTSTSAVLTVLPPAVTGVTASPANGIEGVGQAILLTIAMSRPVFVSGGTPTLALNNESTATYDAAATAALGDPTKLVFDYVVSSGDGNTTALAIVGESLNGATVQDVAANNADFTAVAASFPTLQISTTPTTALVANGSPLAGPGGSGGFVPPAIAGLSNGDLALAWVMDNPQTGQFDLQLGLLDPSGNVIASAALPNIGVDASPELAPLAGGGMIVTWTQSGPNGVADEREVVFNGVGSIINNSTAPIGPSGSTATSLAPTPGGGAVGTYESKVVGAGGVETDSVYAVLFGNNGSLLGGKLLAQLSSPSGLIESPNVIALASGGYVASWVQYQVPGVTGEQAVAQVFDNNGAPIGSTFVFASLPSNAGTADQYAVAALGNGDFVAVWLDAGGAVMGQIYNEVGKAIGSNLQIAAGYAGGSDASVSVAALSTGGFAVGWVGVDQSNGLNEVMLQTFGGDGSKVGSVIGQDLAAGTPNANVVVAALSSGGAAMTWTDTNIHAQLLAPGPGGDLTVSGNTKLELYGASTANVVFAAGSTGTLKLDASTQFAGIVAGLALGNNLDLADIAYVANDKPVYTPNGGNTGGVLSVTDGTHTASIALLGSYMASSFVTAGDGHGGTLISDPPASQQATLAQAHA